MTTTYKGYGHIQAQEIDIPIIIVFYPPYHPHHYCLWKTSATSSWSSSSSSSSSCMPRAWTCNQALRVTSRVRLRWTSIKGLESPQGLPPSSLNHQAVLQEGQSSIWLRSQNQIYLVKIPGQKKIGSTPIW